MTDKQFIDKYNEDGKVLINNIISPYLVKQFKNEIKIAIQKETEFHGSNKYQDYGMVLCCVKYGGSFLKIFENDKLFKPFELILGKDCIMYSNTSSSMPPKKSNYSKRIHIDSPMDYPNNFPLRMQCLILLDDFNNDNGATWFLPNSHTLKSKPDNSFFYKNAKKLTATAGSILYWNPKIWHSGGDNITDSWRDAFTIVMTRPFCKQRMDIPTMLGEVNLNDKAKRRLGYFNVPPKSYKYYYERK